MSTRGRCRISRVGRAASHVGREARSSRYDTTRSLITSSGRRKRRPWQLALGLPSEGGNETVRALVVVLLLARVAHGDDVALVSSDRALAGSLPDAGNHVIVTTDPAPPMDDLAPRSKEIAIREG